jgi:hypothetical protein
MVALTHRCHSGNDCTDPGGQAESGSRSFWYNCLPENKTGLFSAQGGGAIGLAAGRSRKF